MEEKKKTEERKVTFQMPSGPHSKTFLKSDFERMGQGLPPLPEKKVEPKKEPELPKVENQIDISKLDLKKLFRIERIQRVNHRNTENQIFVGFNIMISTKGEDSQPISGWIIESDLLKILPQLRDETAQEILNTVGY